MSGEALRLVDETLWAVVAPLFPRQPHWNGRGRPRVSDRAVLAGILYVLEQRIAWWKLPAELGCGSGHTCMMRLRAWQESGLWDALRPVLLEHVEHPERFDWARAIPDTPYWTPVGRGR
jgi:transposase